MHAYQPPPTAQPPVQIPFSDPFHNRDPFMPSSQHRRKDSYGGPVGAALTPMVGERAWGGQPGPQLPPNLSHVSHNQPAHYHHDPNRQPNPYENARRRSLGAGASPPRYGGPLEPPPPPPPFQSRNMPPPSPSSVAAPSFPTHGPRGPPSASPFGGPRETSAFTSRPGGGMSIGSLIGNDKPSNGDKSPKAMTTQNSPTFRPSHPLSPKRARSTSMREGYNRAPRPLSPRSHAYAQQEHRDERDRWFTARPFGGPPHPAGPPGASSSFRPYQSSPTSVTGQSPHTNGPGIPSPARPNSQPTASMQERIEAWRAAQPEHRIPGGFREYGPAQNEPAHRYDMDERHARPLMDHGRQAETQPPPIHAPYPPPPHREDRDPYARHPYHALDRRPEYDDRRPPEPRPVPAAASSPPTAADNMGFESRFRHYGGPPQDRDRMETSSQPGGRRDDDGHPVQRSFLTVSPELNRKGGRASPLPQAVQGAQPRLMGPGRDPSIKNEFGRMFSGLGSGVGGSSTPTGPFSASGNLTPSRLSPSRFADGDHERPEDHDNVVDGNSILHRADRSETAREDMDSLNGRNTPTASHKANKRAKTAHHHHHHGHAHHHHHHHHTPVEDNASARGGFSTLRFPSNPSAAQANQPPTVHHHHHHHNHAVHPPHHHHHTKPAPPPPAPEIHVRNQEVFDLAKSKPRVHLGSALYEPFISLPSNKRVLLDTKHLFAPSPKPIPFFPERENSTFTVRVPRSYLVPSALQSLETSSIAGGLEAICERRHIWGTEIYTDDSDVVAAAVHSGWIKGDFGEWNEDIKDLFSDEHNGTNGINGTNGDAQLSPTHGKLVNKPAHPAAIPADKDMHVTVIILPPLKDYVGTTMNFLKSRNWGKDHDGMSFIIQKVEFVDEGRETRFAERGMMAKKKRAREEMRRREAAESLLGLGRGRGVGVGA
ncbi:hypothetical protein B9Z65_5930 [Elsinoe australis]|uniref:Histone deacetylation protein Rxt3 n=1 Tax=Elsinoe australis TaxID=40998 RepID=A0A2P7YJL4_9PEZI|nr:hypothetical protein B9Z65_5930 [Elsinoe australis]